MVAHEVLGDDSEAITAAIRRMLDAGCEMVLCTGGKSVDPDEPHPAGHPQRRGQGGQLRRACSAGAMFLVAYNEDGRPVCGLPGCVMYAKRTVFDLALPRLLADVRSPPVAGGPGQRRPVPELPECHFPNCGFGKGV